MVSCTRSSASLVVVGEAKGVAAQALPQRHDLTHEPCSQIGVRATPLDRCSCTGRHRVMALRGHRRPPARTNAALPVRQHDRVCPCRPSVLVVYHIVGHVDGKTLPPPTTWSRFHTRILRSVGLVPRRSARGARRCSRPARRAPRHRYGRRAPVLPAPRRSLRSSGR